MNRFIEFIKRIFSKKTLALTEGKNIADEKYLNQKETFLNSIKAEDSDTDILLMQKRLENGLLEESQLNSKQVQEMKDLYCKQILDLMDSIKKYKLKLN